MVNCSTYFCSQSSPPAELLNEGEIGIFIEQSESSVVILVGDVIEDISLFHMTGIKCSLNDSGRE